MRKCYEEAGAICAEVLAATALRVQPGVRVHDICRFSEEKIREFGNARPAFPLNVSLDSTAAHSTSSGDQDHRRIPENCLCKVDLGVHVDGFIADCAVTVCIGNLDSGLVEAADIALRAAIDVIHDGVSLSTIGRTVQEAIEERGYNAIRNLTGHEVKRYSLHAGLSVPSVQSTIFSRRRLREGMVIAVEPFATNGSAGFVTNSPKEPPLIFSVNSSESSDPVVKRLHKSFGSLPFAARWAYPLLPKAPEKARLKRLIQLPGISAYPPLIEASGGLVAHSEHTIVVGRRTAEVTTSFGT